MCKYIHEAKCEELWIALHTTCIVTGMVWPGSQCYVCMWRAAHVSTIPHPWRALRPHTSQQEPSQASNKPLGTSRSRRRRRQLRNSSTLGMLRDVHSRFCLGRNDICRQAARLLRWFAGSIGKPSAGLRSRAGWLGVWPVLGRTAAAPHSSSPPPVPNWPKTQSQPRRTPCCCSAIDHRSARNSTPPPLVDLILYTPELPFILAVHRPSLQRVPASARCSRQPESQYPHAPAHSYRVRPRSAQGTTDAQFILPPHDQPLHHNPPTKTVVCAITPDLRPLP